IDSQIASVRPEIAVRSLCRLLHYISKLTGQCQPLRTGQKRCLYEQHFAAHLGHRQTGSDPWRQLLPGRLVEKHLVPEIALQIVRRHGEYVTFTLSHFQGYFSRKPSYRSLELPNTRLTRIAR